MTPQARIRMSTCDINVVVIRETDRAVLVKPAFRDGAEQWVPISQVQLTKNEGSQTHLLVGPHWLFAEKGWL